MEYQAIQNKVIAVFKRVFPEKININDFIKPDQNLKEMISFSSLEAIEIIACLEDEFKIEIEDELLNIDFLSTIDNISKYISEKLLDY